MERHPDWSPLIPNPGYPWHVLPVLSLLPDWLTDDICDDTCKKEPCQCLQVAAVHGPSGPFSLDQCECVTCHKPVTPGQNTRTHLKWVIVSHRMLQKWNARWWSALPAVRQFPPAYNWFEGYTSYKYKLNPDRFVPRVPWPNYVLPVVSLIPASLCDDDTRQEPCQCLQVHEVFGPMGPFDMQDKCRCQKCLKPVTPGKNCPVQVKWIILSRMNIQLWNYKYWADLPAVRQQYHYTFFEGYASYKYRPARE